MKIIVTLDYWDGAKSKSKTMYAEDLTGNLIALTLIGKGVAGMTITNADSLKSIVRQMNPEQDPEQ
jgi:hypothetical protein